MAGVLLGDPTLSRSTALAQFPAFQARWILCSPENFVEVAWRRPAARNQETGQAGKEASMSDLVSRTDSGDLGKEAEEAGRIGEAESEEVSETAAMRWTKSTELEALPRTDMKRPWNWMERLTSSSSSWELVWWLRLMHVGPHTIPSSRRALRCRVHRKGAKESPGQEHRKKKSTSNSKGKGRQHNERASSKTMWRTSQTPPVSASSLRNKPQNPRNYFHTPELERKRYTFALSEVSRTTVYSLTIVV